MRLHFTFLLCLCFSLFVQAQAANKPIKLYYINVDSVSKYLKETQLKNDSLTVYREDAEAMINELRSQYRIRKQESDSLYALWLANGQPRGCILEIGDSAELISAYKNLYIQELKAIDSNLTKNINDSILVHSTRFAELNKMNHVHTNEEVKVLLSTSIGKYESIDITKRFIEYMNNRNWVKAY